MKTLLIGLYPARWRARYGDEFAAILDDRPLGPFDVADIVLGALDAQLRLRGTGSFPSQTKEIPMSLRIGGLAAIIGAPLWTGGFAIANGAFGNADLKTGSALVIAGSLALLVALAGLSAFQARVQPAMSWAAFALPAIGTLAMIVGAVGLALGDTGLTDAFFFGLVAFFVGSLLFAIATYRTGLLSRPGAVILGVGMLPAFVAGNGNEMLILAALISFAVGWVVLGVDGIRRDRPKTEHLPAGSN